MNRRIQQFLSAENISQAQFADHIGVARASVSHIVSGRNKPGFDFIEKMTAHYPNLNVEWLITGRGRMYKNSAELFPQNLDYPGPEEADPVPYFDLAPDISPAQVQPEPAAQPQPTRVAKPTDVTENHRNIVKIVVFYDDNTFQELI